VRLPLRLRVARLRRVAFVQQRIERCARHAVGGEAQYPFRGERKSDDAALLVDFDDAVVDDLRQRREQCFGGQKFVEEIAVYVRR